MANNPITVPLPQDLPETWATNQIVSPDGVSAGLTPQHGYNYLMQQVNAAQQAAEELGEGLTGLSGDNIPESTGSETSIRTALSNKANKSETIIWTLSSPSDLTTPGRIGVAYMTDQVNTNVTDGKIMTDYSAGDFHCILLASNFSDLGCEFGVLIVTSPRLPGTVWVGQIWEYKFNAWYKMPTATPPQEYDLPLSDGLTGNSYYCKTQEGLVLVRISIVIGAEVGYLTTIGTLPAGFRPSNNVAVTAAAGADGAVATTVLGIYPSGAIMNIGQTVPAGASNRIYAEAFFIATN